MVLRTSNNLNLGGAESGARALADLLVQAGKSTGEGYANVGNMLANAGQMVGQRKMQRQARSDMLSQRAFENQRQTANDALERQYHQEASDRASLALFTDMHSKMQSELVEAVANGDQQSVAEIQARMKNLGTATASLLPRVGINPNAPQGQSQQAGSKWNQPGYGEQGAKGNWGASGPPPADYVSPTAPGRLTPETSILPPAKDHAAHIDENGVVCDGNTCRKPEAEPVDPDMKAVQENAAKAASLRSMADDIDNPKLRGKDGLSDSQRTVKKAQLLAEAAKFDAAAKGAHEKMNENQHAALAAQQAGAQLALKQKQDMEFGNSYLRSKGLLPTRTETDTDADTGLTEYGSVDVPFTDTKDLGEMHSLIKQGESESRVEEARRKGINRSALKASETASNNADLAEGWRDEPWAKGKDDAWIAKNGPLIHREMVKAKAGKILADAKDETTGMENLKKEAMLAADAADSARKDFTDLRAADYEEKYPSTKKAFAHWQKVRDEAEGLRAAYNARVGGQAAPAAPKDPEVDAIEKSAMSDEDKLKALDALKASRAGPR